MQRQVVIDLDGRAQIDRRVLFDLHRQWLVGVVVAFVFQHQGQRVPGRLVFDAAEDGRAAAEHAAELEVAAVIAGRVAARLETASHHCQRIAEVATRAQIAPTEAQAEVEVAEALAGDQILGAEQARTAEISQAHRDFGLIAAFLQQAELGVEGFIQVVAVRGGRAIADGFHRDIAKAQFHPVEGRRVDAEALVGLGAAVGEAQFALGRKTRRGRLHQAHATEVALGFAGRRMGDLRAQQSARHAECQPAIACQGRALLGA